jgi:probable HAF family extracellular repeat protein
MKIAEWKSVGMLFIVAFGLACGVTFDPATAKSNTPDAVEADITITDLGLIPGGTFSSGLAINNQPIIVGLANDSTFALQRPFWNANTGVIVGFADNFNPASTAIPEHVNDSREMGGTELYGDNVYQGIYWNPAGQAFVLPPLAGFDPVYGALHTKAHGINNLSQLVGTGKEGEPNFYTHAALWLDNDTEALDLGFLGQGVPLNYSEAYGINNLTHVVGNSAIGSAIHGFLWRNGQMIDLGTLSGQVVSEAKAINNTGMIAGKVNIFPVIWEYDINNANRAPRIRQLPIPAGFFAATTTAVNDSGDVVGYAGSPNIDSHAILWRAGVAIDLGVWPGGHYSVANGINNLGQIIGTGTISGDNLDHALIWTVDDGTSNTPPVASLQAKPSKLHVGENLSVKASFTDPDNGPWTYGLNWGDGSSTTGSISTAGKLPIGPHVYTQAGNFVVQLSVTDSLGASDTSSALQVKVR